MNWARKSQKEKPLGLCNPSSACFTNKEQREREVKCFHEVLVGAKMKLKLLLRFLV